MVRKLIFMPSRMTGARMACLIMSCLLVFGCGPRDRSSEFIPSVSVAESAVKAGMEAWKKGEPAGTVAGTKRPVIHVVDSERAIDQTLIGYEILGEVPGNAPRCFAVRVQLSNPEKEVRLRYIVVGIDPLWVFRQEDYDRLSHWAHPMEDEKKNEPTNP